MEICAIDTGYSHTKCSNGMLFESKVGKGSILIPDSETHMINVEIGGYTIDCCIMQNGSLIQNSIFTIPNGYIPLKQNLIHYLNGEYGTNLNDITIDTVIKKGCLENYPKSNNDIAETIDLYIRNVINTLVTSNWDMDNMDILLTGGGATALGVYFKRYIVNGKVMQNPQFSNVRGFYNVAKTLYS